MLSIIRRTACEYARNLSREVQVDIGDTEVRMQRHVDRVADEPGGIRDLDTALALIQVGATRIGTSSGIQIVEAYKELKKGL